MILVLFFAQIVLVVLQYGAAIVDLSPFIVFLPMMLIAVPWIIAVTNGWTVNIDTWPAGGSFFEPRSPRTRRSFQARR